MRTGGPGRRTIDIQVIIDVDLTLRSSPQPGKGAVAPASTGPVQGYMIVTGARGATQQGTGDVAFDARAGETVRFFATSGSNNFEQSVYIQDIRQAGGEEVLVGFESVTEERMGLAPASATSVLPAQLVPQQFGFYQCETARGGSGSYQLVLALYTRDEDGQPRLAGLYPWEPRITVQEMHEDEDPTAKEKL
jgi:hypothetical protein